MPPSDKTVSAVAKSRQSHAVWNHRRDTEKWEMQEVHPMSANSSAPVQDDLGGQRG